jgi:hypothetical protein
MGVLFCCWQVAIKKVLQDKRFKNRELQIMKMVNHPNIVRLKQCFYSTTEKDETYLHLVLEYVPDTVYRISKSYSKNNQRMPPIFVKLYTYQARGSFTGQEPLFVMMPGLVLMLTPVMLLKFTLGMCRGCVGPLCRSSTMFWLCMLHHHAGAMHHAICFC